MPIHLSSYAINTLRSAVLGALICLSNTMVSAAEYAAILEWSQHTTLSTPVSGVITKILVRIGDQVQKNQPLVQLDARLFMAELRRAQAQVSRFKLVQDETRREWERTRELYERTVISEHDLQLAEIAHKVAEADLIGAEAQLTEAKFNMEHSEIRAPFDGKILNLAIQPGQTIINTHMATPMLSMASDNTMLARVETTFEDLARLRPESKVEIQINNKRYQGRVIGSTPRSPIRCDEKTSSPNFLVSFQPDGGRLYEGMPARVTTRP